VFAECVYVCVRVCMYVWSRACVRACARARARVCVYYENKFFKSKCAFKQIHKLC